MATSPNYGWLEPDNTDLVKNGALAIRTLGNAIDTTMATMTPKSIVDAKGDLIAASANDTPARLAVGNNGETLVADSSTATGLSYQGLFGANKNKIINGDFKINQRNFTSNTSSGDVYEFDRWVSQSATTGTVTRTAQVFTTGAAPVAGYEGTNFYRYDVTGQSGATARAQAAQLIESVRTFAGQTITISFWAKAATGTPAIAVALQQGFGTGGSPSSTVTTAAGKKTVGTSWARYSYTVTVPSISGKTLGTNNNDSLVVQIWFSAGSNYDARTTTLGVQNNTFDIWGVQAEAGSVATPFQTATGTLQGELAACQRYYQKSYDIGTAPQTNTTTAGLVALISSANSVVANEGRIGPVWLKVSMRTTPTVTIYSYTSSTAGVVSNGTGTDLAASSGLVEWQGNNGFVIYNSSGGNITPANNTFAAHYVASAEL